MDPWISLLTVSVPVEDPGIRRGGGGGGVSSDMNDR